MRETPFKPVPDGTTPVDPFDAGWFELSRFEAHDFSVSDLATFLSDRCLVARAQLRADPFLMLTDEHRSPDPDVATARWASLTEFTQDNERFIYRGMQVLPSTLSALLSAGMKNTREHHFMLTFGWEPALAVAYSLDPAKTSIPVDVPALSVLVQADIHRLRAAGIAVQVEPTYGKVIDIWGDIPPQLLERVAIYDAVEKRFVLISECLDSVAT